MPVFAKVEPDGSVTVTGTPGGSGGGGDETGPWIYVGTPTQVGSDEDPFGTLISDLIAANPSPYDSTPWVPFTNGNNSLGDDAPLSFCLDRDFVVIRGGVTGVTVGQEIFVLPSGFRPFYQQELVVPGANSSSFATVLVTPDGSVTFTGSS